MRKVLILLLVIGFLIGTFPAAEVICEEGSSVQSVATVYDPVNGPGDPVLCGGGGSGSGGVPG